MICKECGEEMSGDGFNFPIRCPNSKPELSEFNEPDANPVYCDGEAETVDGNW